MECICKICLSLQNQLEIFGVCHHFALLEAEMQLGWRTYCSCNRFSVGFYFSQFWQKNYLNNLAVFPVNMLLKDKPLPQSSLLQSLNRFSFRICHHFWSPSLSLLKKTTPTAWCCYKHSSVMARRMWSFSFHKRADLCLKFVLSPDSPTWAMDLHGSHITRGSSSALQLQEDL